MCHQELTDRVGAVHFNTISCTAESFKHSEVMKGRPDKEKFDITFLARLQAHLVSPKEKPVRMVKQKGVLNSRNKAVASRVIWVSATPAFTF